MLTHLIIDGYNAIAKIKEFEAKKEISLEVSRAHFIKALVDFTRRKKVFSKITVVFDSKDNCPCIRKDSYGKVEVIFTDGDRDADKVIVDILKENPAKEDVTVASDDNFVRNNTRAFGKKGLSVRELEDIIMLKKTVPLSKIEGKEIAMDRRHDINEELKKHWGLR